MKTLRTPDYLPLASHTHLCSGPVSVRLSALPNWLLPFLPSCSLPGSLYTLAIHAMVTQRGMRSPGKVKGKVTVHL